MGAPKGKRPNSKDSLAVKLPKDVMAKLRLAAAQHETTLTNMVEMCLLTTETLDTLTK